MYTAHKEEKTKTILKQYSGIEKEQYRKIIIGEINGNYANKLN